MDGFPYLLNASSFRNYSWGYDSSNNRITSFNKSLTEIPFEVKIVDDGSVEDCKNRIYEVFDHDVLNKESGKMYIGDYYLKGYVVKSDKSNYLASKNHATLSFTFVTERPWWVKDNLLTFVKEGIYDIENWLLKGKTDENFQSIAEDGTLELALTEESGEIHSLAIATEPIRSLFEVYDRVCKNFDGNYGKFKAIELVNFGFADLTMVIDRDFKTYRLELTEPSTSTYKSNKLKTNAGATDNPDVDAKSGISVVSDATVDSVCHADIYGSEEGIASFTLHSLDCSPELLGITWEGMASYTWEDMASRSWEEVSFVNLQSIEFNLDSPLMQGEVIRMDLDGAWKVFRADGTMEVLGDTLQEALSNLKTFSGHTEVFTTGDDSPELYVTFKGLEYINNRISNTEVLPYALEEFVLVNGNTVTVRVQDSALEDLMLLYQLQNETFIAFDDDAQAFFNVAETIDDISAIVVRDPLIEGSDNDSFYPHDYPYGYGKGKIAKAVVNESMKPSTFVLKIYGRADHPQIVINGHVYQVNDILEKGEYIIVDAAEKTITKYLNSGEVRNIFSKRFKEQSIFEPIPAEAVTIDWDRTFGFDLTIHDERGEPKWT